MLPTCVLICALSVPADSGQARRFAPCTALQDAEADADLEAVRKLGRDAQRDRSLLDPARLPLPPKIKFPSLKSIIDFDKEIEETEQLLASFREKNAPQKVIDACEQVIGKLREGKEKFKSIK
jgi:hypothetical protein